MLTLWTWCSLLLNVRCMPTFHPRQTRVLPLRRLVQRPWVPALGTHSRCRVGADIAVCPVLSSPSASLLHALDWTSNNCCNCCRVDVEGRDAPDISEEAPSVHASVHRQGHRVSAAPDRGNDVVSEVTRKAQARLYHARPIRKVQCPKCTDDGAS